MSKKHNIVTWIMMAGAMLAGGKEWNSQNTESTTKANITQVQHSTSQQLIGLDQYNYKEMLYMDISLLAPEVVKKVMFERINEIRKEHWLKVLKYDKRLEEIATEFSKEKNWTQWRNEKHPHNNKMWWWPRRRIYETPLRNEIEEIEVNWVLYWIEENIVSATTTVNWQMKALMESKNHRKAILSEYINSVWIWYEQWSLVLVQLFANIKNKP